MAPHSVFADSRAAAIAAAKRLAPGCENCLFFALPAHSPLIKKHDLYFVSTLDRIPPPFWTVAIARKGEPVVLSALKLDGWNQVIRAEKPTLKTDADVETYIKAYLDLAVGHGLFLSGLLPGELATIRKKIKAAPEKSLHILREKELLSVSFYAKSVSGMLQFWDLLLEPNGKILKADVQEFR